MTGNMKVLYADGSSRETRYGMTSMAAVIMGIHDKDSPIVGYMLEGRDY